VREFERSSKVQRPAANKALQVTFDPPAVFAIAKSASRRVGKAQRAHAVFESGLQESIMSGPWLSHPQSLHQVAICASAFTLRGHAALCPPYKTADSPLQRLHTLPAAGTDDARRPQLRGRQRHGRDFAQRPGRAGVRAPLRSAAGVAGGRRAGARAAPLPELRSVPGYPSFNLLIYNGCIGASRRVVRRMVYALRWAAKAVKAHFA